MAWSSVSMADFVRYLAGFARADGLVVAVGHPSVMVGLFERHGGANFPCTWCCVCVICNQNAMFLQKNYQKKLKEAKIVRL